MSQTRARRLEAKKESMDAFDSRQDCHNFTNDSRRVVQLPNWTIRSSNKRHRRVGLIKRRNPSQTCRDKFVELGLRVITWALASLAMVFPAGVEVTVALP
jgi:hypothetical protein